MKLPFRVRIYDPPALATLRRLWWAWALIAALVAIGIGFLVWHFAIAQPALQAVAADQADLKISGSPSGAQIQIDGKDAGHMPALVHVRAGKHVVRVTAAGYFPTSVPVDVHAPPTLDVHLELWPAQPRLRQLRPPLPGSSIAGISFLGDGRLDVAVAVPPGDERQLWIEGPGGQQQRAGPPSAQSSVAVSRDGQTVAYFTAPSSGALSVGQPTELWLSSGDGSQASRRYALSQSSGAGQLLDVSWSSDGQHLLLAARPGGANGQRTTLSLLPAQGGDPRTLVSLPSDLVLGSETWSPDGRQVAFLTTAGNTTALCVLDVQSGDFRYLGDVAGGLSHPLPLAPASWSPSGTLLYSALNRSSDNAVGWLLGSGMASTLFSLRTTAALPQPIHAWQGQSPAELPDGSVLALARGKAAGPLLLRDFLPDGSSIDGPGLPISSGSVYAARWDVERRQAVIAVKGDGLSSEGDQYWLASFGREERP